MADFFQNTLIPGYWHLSSNAEGGLCQKPMAWAFFDPFGKDSSLSVFLPWIEFNPHDRACQIYLICTESVQPNRVLFDAKSPPCLTGFWLCIMKVLDLPAVPVLAVLLRCPCCPRRLPRPRAQFGEFRFWVEAQGVNRVHDKAFFHALQGLGRHSPNEAKALHFHGSQAINPAERLEIEPSKFTSTK